MTAPIHTTQNWQPEQYDMVIDVRSPSEFADDHIEGAVNLPALFDHERAVVGTLYKQTSAFAARKTGAAFMSHNIAHHLETFLQDKPADFRPPNQGFVAVFAAAPRPEHLGRFLPTGRG